MQTSIKKKLRQSKRSKKEEEFLSIFAKNNTFYSPHISHFKNPLPRNVIYIPIKRGGA